MPSPTSKTYYIADQSKPSLSIGNSSTLPETGKALATLTIVKEAVHSASTTLPQDFDANTYLLQKRVEKIQLGFNDKVQSHLNAIDTKWGKDSWIANMLKSIYSYVYGRSQQAIEEEVKHIKTHTQDLRKKLQESNPLLLAQELGIETREPGKIYGHYDNTVISPKDAKKKIQDLSEQVLNMTKTKLKAFEKYKNEDPLTTLQRLNYEADTEELNSLISNLPQDSTYDELQKHLTHLMTNSSLNKALEKANTNKDFKNATSARKSADGFLQNILAAVDKLPLKDTDQNNGITSDEREILRDYLVQKHTSSIKSASTERAPSPINTQISDTEVQAEWQQYCKAKKSSDSLPSGEQNLNGLLNTFIDVIEAVPASHTTTYQNLIEHLINQISSNVLTMDNYNQLMPALLQSKTANKNKFIDMLFIRRKNDLTIRNSFMQNLFHGTQWPNTKFHKRIKDPAMQAIQGFWDNPQATQTVDWIKKNPPKT